MKPESLLIVDDNEMNRDLLSRRLERKGYAVSVAENGHKTLEWVGQHAVDLVLLDIEMPGTSGLEVLKILRQTCSSKPTTGHHGNGQGSKPRYCGSPEPWSQ